jgi:hypothetical protein
MSNHNKKRNSILLYEFLVQTISKALIDNDKPRSSTALKILRRHFKPGTELYKEFRLMNALVKTTVSSQHVADSILKEAKAAAASMNTDALDREKSLLIKSINHNLNDGTFYDQHVNDYRSYATIQMLVNEWRSKDKNIALVAKYEDSLMQRLTEQKTSESDSTISDDSSGTSRILMKIMTKKLNEKYSGVLNDQQRSLIKAYALSAASDDPKTLRMKLHEIKSDVLGLIESYSSDESSNEFMRKKLNETRDVILSENVDAVDDETVTRFMLYSRLKNELESKE